MREGKTSLTKLILEKFQEASDLAFDAIFPKNRIEGKVWRQILGLPTGYEFSPRTFSTILYRLKKDGLVVKTGPHRKSIWSLTDKGKNFVTRVVEPSLPKEDGIVRLVMFDIPEKESGKRRLTRERLLASGFSQLQKSVWVGYRPLPQKFIEFLDDMKLKGKVQIVSIDKKGTLETI